MNNDRDGDYRIDDSLTLFLPKKMKIIAEISLKRIEISLNIYPSGSESIT